MLWMSKSSLLMCWCLCNHSAIDFISDSQYYASNLDNILMMYMFCFVVWGVSFPFLHKQLSCDCSRSVVVLSQVLNILCPLQVMLAVQLNACLHTPSPSPSPSRSSSPSKFIIVCIETDLLMDRLSSEPILSVKQSVTIHTMLNFDGDFDRHGHGDDMCKQTLKHTQRFVRLGSTDNFGSIDFTFVKTIEETT